MDTDNSTVKDIAALAVANAAPRVDGAAGAAPFVILPDGYTVREIEHTLPAPLRKRGTFNLRDAASFIRMVKEQQTEGTRLFGSLNPPGFRAVFDDHSAAVPGWRDHVAAYSCPLSVEWKTWAGMNKKLAQQPDFAQFIEDNAPDCTMPDSATMIEIARTLQAKKGVSFASGIRLSNGETQFAYEETVQGKAGEKGQFSVPEVFQIAIPVLEGGDRWRLDARFRYRIGDGGKLTLWYDLERPHKVLEEAIKEVWKAIEAGTGLAIFNGE